MKKLYIKTLEINNFRHIINPIKLTFNEHINYLTGKNGVGKTTIIDAIIYLIYKSDENKKTTLTNINHIDDQGGVSKKNPSIKLLVNFDNEDIELELNNKKLYIDNIEESNYDSYKKRLEKKLYIKDLSFLFKNIIPIAFLDIIKSRRSDESNELKKSFLTVANIKNGYIIKQSKIDENNDNITNITDELKNKSKEKKEIEEVIKHFENEYPDIDFNTINEDDIDNSKIELKKEEVEIKNRISNYKIKQQKNDDIISKISNRTYEKKIKGNELEKLNYSKEDIEKRKIYQWNELQKELKQKEQDNLKLQQDNIQMKKEKDIQKGQDFLKFQQQLSEMLEQINSIDKINNKNEDYDDYEEPVLLIKDIILTILTFGFYFIYWKFLKNKKEKEAWLLKKKKHEDKITRLKKDELLKQKKKYQEIKMIREAIIKEAAIEEQRKLEIDKEIEKDKIKMIHQQKKMEIDKEIEKDQFHKNFEVKNQTAVQKFSELTKRMIELDSEISNLKKLEIKLSIELYEINIEKLLKRENEISSQLDSDEKQDYIINKYSTHKKNLNNKIKEVISLKIKLSSNEEELKKYYEAINSAVKSTFKDYEIDLFKHDKSIEISKNGIKWNYLNNGDQLKLLYQINDFLKTETKINTFSLIDNAESINKIEKILDKDTQYIISSVNGDELKFNNEYIY